MSDRISRAFAVCARFFSKSKNPIVVRCNNNSLITFLFENMGEVNNVAKILAEIRVDLHLASNVTNLKS